MNTKKIITGVIALILLQTPVAVRAADAFGAPELGYKIFGTWASKDREDFKDEQLGIGAAVNYFFTSNFGIEADTYLEDVDWLDHLDLSVIGRYPISSISVAPYAYAGFGRQWFDVPQWTCHIGAGAEYRWSGRTGIFFDARQVFADRSEDLTLLRLGVRFGF